MNHSLRSCVFVPIFFVILPCSGSGQFVKLWELGITTDFIGRPSYGIHSAPLLKTFPASDGGIVVLGRKLYESGGQKIYFFKFDVNGNIVWEYTYESPYALSEKINDVAVDPAGNIIAGGEMTTFVMHDYEYSWVTSKYLLLKISPDGELVWLREFQGVDFHTNYCASVVADNQGNIYTTGAISIDSTKYAVVNKFDAEGNMIWSNNVDRNRAQEVTLAGDLLLFTTKGDTSKVYQYSTSGDKIFEDNSDWPGIYNPVYDQKGNRYRLSATGEFAIEKFNIYGTSLWRYKKPSQLPPNVFADEITDCYIAADGAVYVTGRYYGEHYGDTSLYTNCDILTAKLDSNGILLWENIYNFDGRRSCQIGERILVDDSGYTYVLGYQSVQINNNIFASTDMVLLKYNRQGHRIDSLYFDEVPISENYGINMVIDHQDLYILGWSQDPMENYDHSVIKYSNMHTGVQDFNRDNTFVVYPNPNREHEVHISCNLNISEIWITDLAGRVVVYNGNYQHNQALILPQNIPTGLYTLTALWNRQIISSPLVIYSD